MLVTASHQANQDVFVSFDKEALKQIASVATHPLFSDEANWVMVSIVFKHNASIKRLVSGFKGNFTKTDNVKVQPDMISGEVYELHEILISGTDREPILSIDRSEIANASSMDLTLGEGIAPPPPPSEATVVLSSVSSANIYDVFSITATFNKSVTGFTSEDVTVSNASISNFSGSGTTYAFDVIPLSEGEITIQVGSSKVDGGNSASNIISKNYYSPVSVVLSSSSSENVLGGFSVTATFASEVTGFSLDDISVNNCTISNLSGSGTTYTFDVSPVSAGTLTLQVSSGGAQNINGANSSASNTLSRYYVAPISVTLVSSSSGSNIYLPFSVTATFQDDVIGFSQSSLSIVNGTASNFSGSGNVYTFTITPTSTGLVSVQIPSSIAYSPTTSAQNSASNTVSFQYYAPASVVLSSSAGEAVTGGFTVTATFSEAVAGFTLGDLDLTNCTASNLEFLSTSLFQFYLTPITEGSVNVQVRSNVVQTFANGAGNTVSNTLSTAYLLSGYRYYKFAAKKAYDRNTTAVETNTIGISEIGFKWNDQIQKMAGNGYTVTFLKATSGVGTGDLIDDTLGGSVGYAFRNWILNGSSFEDLFKIDLNQKRDVQAFFLGAQTESSYLAWVPKEFKLYGSNDNSTWVEILSVNDSSTAEWTAYRTSNGGRRSFNIGSYSSNLYIGASASNWGASSNWLSNYVPNAVGDYAEFYGSGGAQSVNLDLNVTLDKLYFYKRFQTVSSSSSNTLTFAGNNKLITIDDDITTNGTPVVSAAINATNGLNISGGAIKFSGVYNGSSATLNNYSSYLELTGASNNFASAIVNNYKNLYASSGSLAGGATVNLDTINNDIDFGATMATGSINFIGNAGKQITISGTPKVTALSAPVTLGGTVDGTLRLYTSGAGMGLVSAANVTFGNNSKILVDSNTNSAEIQLPLNINSNTKIQVGSETSTVNGAVPFARFNAGYTAINNTIDMVGSPDYVNGAVIRTYGTNCAVNGNIILDAKGTSKTGTKFLLSGYGSGGMIVNGTISNFAPENASNCTLYIENPVVFQGTNSFTSPLVIGYTLAGAQAGSLTVKSALQTQSITMSDGTLKIDSPVSSISTSFTSSGNTNAKYFYYGGTLNGNMSIVKASTNATGFRLYPYYFDSATSTIKAESAMTLNGNFTVNGSWSIYPTAVSGNKMSKFVVNGNVDSSTLLSVSISSLPIGAYTVMEYTGTWTGTPTFTITGTGNGTCSISHDAVTKKVTITRTA